MAASGPGERCNVGWSFELDDLRASCLDAVDGVVTASCLADWTATHCRCQSGCSTVLE